MSPGDYSMISLGIVLFDEKLETTFYGQLKPISEKWIPEALAVSGHSREQTMEFDCPKEVMQNLADWIEKVNVSGRPMFFSDNNGFDWQFINWYFHHFLEINPFGHSSTNINSIYKGRRNNMRDNIKRLRKTKHTHHPVDDAKGNAEALLKMMKQGLKINF
jgi:hypothetical protein